ncbi:mitochondrial carrier protein [Coprinellus micaceus]|uniref:Small ribosomal subunit protein mS29 n=1 Tax=Coprinellus micaceus TaxID=71717 RepID=A0A4Y7SVX7_COPMI|nr:mitochondrial carrier protein [Coprinellus micaceus]
MSLLSSQHRHVALALAEAGSVLRAGQYRTAVTRAAPAQKQSQSIGGVKRGRKEKWEKKMNQERAQRNRDIPKFTRYPESKLQIPKTKERPAILPEVFQPGSGHSLDLPLFGPSTLTAKSVGQATSFDTTQTNAAKVFGLPNKMHFEYRILSTPCSVIRDVTLKAIHTLDKAKGSSSKDHRIVLHGRAGSGKSFLLHQVVQYAQTQGWVVLYIPRAVTLVNSTNSYTYDIRTQTYLQPRASYLTLDKLYKANSALLSQLTLSRELVTEKLNIPAGTTLAEVAQAGIKDKSFTSGPVVLETVLKELETQTKFPVLVAVDDFQALFHNSAYKDPFFQAIRPHHLSLPRTFLEFASGQRTLANGVFIGALTESDTAYAVPLELKDALNLESRHPVSPYDKRDQVKLGYTEGLKGLKVPERMSTNEMAGLFSVWKDDMALTTDKYDELFMSKYVESDGNPRDFVWKGLLSTLSP